MSDFEFIARFPVPYIETYITRYEQYIADVWRVKDLRVAPPFITGKYKYKVLGIKKNIPFQIRVCRAYGHICLECTAKVDLIGGYASETMAKEITKRVKAMWPPTYRTGKRVLIPIDQLLNIDVTFDMGGLRIGGDLR